MCTEGLSLDYVVRKESVLWYVSLFVKFVTFLNAAAVFSRYMQQLCSNLALEVLLTSYLGILTFQTLPVT